MSEQTSAGLTLWYDRPAGPWVEALPLGNGRLGAMVFGDPADERIALNHDTLWSGMPRAWADPIGQELLPQIREAVLAGDPHRADELCKRIQGPDVQSYQPLADLRLRLDHGHAADYRRDLDLDRATASVAYRVDGVGHRRELFCSHPDKVLVVRLSADRPGAISLTVALDSPHPAESRASDDTLWFCGRAPAHVDVGRRDEPHPVRYEDGPDGGGLRFAVGLRARVAGGRVTAESGTLRIDGADRVTLLLAAATSFAGFDTDPVHHGADAEAGAARRLDAAAAHDDDSLRERHLADHQALSRRVSLDLGQPADDVAALPTDERLRRYQEAHDPGLAALLFQYGRYLLIAASRPGTQPANLQGIWNELVQPPWRSNYTVNINTEMNYWPAEPCALPECTGPLFDMLDDLAVTGARVASGLYGMDGWVCHHNSDLWRLANPVGDGVGDPVWSAWPMGGAWMSRHLWERYAYGGDEAFLAERAWPLLAGQCRFMLDWLFEGPEGWLVTCPSTSPEIGYVAPDGQRAACSMGCTMDMAIVWDLFTNTLQAAEVLGLDEGDDAALVERVRAARERLLPPRIGDRGQLVEWPDDARETDVHHRHLSHLFGLHPGRQLTPEQTPELAAACRRSLELRGEGGTGWSLAWKISLWARLADGERAGFFVHRLFRLVETSGFDMSNGGGLYKSLLCAHPPFQIDGNYGYTAGVSEMLLQSHDGTIHLLPALPPAWPDGEVRGLRARGGLEVALTWRDGRLQAADLTAPRGGSFAVRCGEARVELELAAGETVRLDGGLQQG